MLFYYINRQEATQIIFELASHLSVFAISNDGPSIKSGDIPYIFDLGCSVDKEGLGVGLAYCKKMIDHLGGSIRLISKYKDEWTHF